MEHQHSRPGDAGRSPTKNTPLSTSANISAAANPCEPTANSGSAFAALERRKVFAFMLPLAFLLTLVLGTINAIDEQNGLRLTVIGAIGSVVSQSPGLMIAYLFYHFRSSTLSFLLFGAYFIAITGLAAYLNYALNGKADSLNSAAHMHIALFPMLHCFLAFVVYTALGFITLVVSVPSSSKTRDAATTEYCSICKTDVDADDDNRCPTCRWPI